MADREADIIARIAPRRRRRSTPAQWDALAGRGRSVPQPRLPVAARNIGQRRRRHRLDAAADPGRARRRASPPRRRPISRPTARANMCSTMAGPRPGSGRAAPIIPSCRSRCRSRPVPGRRLLGDDRNALLAALETVTVQNGLSSAHITFLHRRRSCARPRRAAGCAATGCNIIGSTAAMPASTISSAALSSRKRKAIRKERAAAVEGLEIVDAARRRDRARRIGTRCGTSIRTPAAANGAGPI